jgi:hypothetical protein
MPVIAVRTASLEKLGNVIKIIGVLLQMKVYLLWSKDQVGKL